MLFQNVNCRAFLTAVEQFCAKMRKNYNGECTHACKSIPKHSQKMFHEFLNQL